MNDEYFEWLLKKTEIGEEYSNLCQVMHEMIFYPLIEMDENRWEDGIAYRFSFFCSDDLVYEYTKQHGGCSVLELLLALAEKTSFDMIGSKFENGIGKWFYEWIENLGLDVYTNEEFLKNADSYFEVCDVLERFVFRKYEYDGSGGVFPLDYPECDQRNEELEIQRNSYLMEKYNIFGG